MLCPLDLASIRYSGIAQPPPSPAPSSSELPTWAIAVIVVIAVLLTLMFACACMMYWREKQGDPIFVSFEEMQKQQEKLKSATQMTPSASSA